MDHENKTADRDERSAASTQREEEVNLFNDSANGHKKSSCTSDIPGLAPAFDGASVKFVVAQMLEWRDDVCYELRALGHVHGSTLRHGKTISGYFTSALKMARAAVEISGRVTAVYFLPQPVPIRLLARAANRLEFYAQDTTCDKEILQRRWFLVDLDPVRFSGVASTDEEHAMALASAPEVRVYVRDHYDLADPIMADSGNGAHLLYRIDYPNDDLTEEYLKEILADLHRKFSDRHVEVDVKTFNAARLFRFYGTMNRKGDEILGNVHRMSRILEI